MSNYSASSLLRESSDSSSLLSSLASVAKCLLVCFAALLVGVERL